MSEPLQQPGKLTGEPRNVDQAYLLLLTIALCFIGAGVAFLLVLPSWKPTANMERQPYHQPYAESEVFADDMSERPLLGGVVPRPADRSPGIPYVLVRSSGPALFPDVSTATNIPMPITRALLERGQEQYNIYCSVCHSTAGDGDGMIVRRGFYSPPSYYIPRLVNQTDSYFYNVITNGYGTMFSYSERLCARTIAGPLSPISARCRPRFMQHPELEAQLQKERGVRP